MKKEIYRLFISFGGVAFDFLNRLKLRKLLSVDSPSVINVLLGSLPSFTASFCGYYFISFFVHSAKGRQHALFGVGFGVLMQELQQYFLEPAKIVGRTFDYFDIVFIFLGLGFAYYLENKSGGFQVTG